jgi:hypothetical protein
LRVSASRVAWRVADLTSCVQFKKKAAFEGQMKSNQPMNGGTITGQTISDEEWSALADAVDRW